ncbi:MAG: hypothetical protein L0Z48_01735 [candidate division Zixibacteria bacterium]|nr:hypothetical protein [candidate division Zixibacteria bacterium]MCI0595244.1 hypothetical protein [candidate division Zixibacteria bacterium]
MRQILQSAFFLLALTGFSFAQRIPLEVSFGVGGYFPEDGRHSHFFEHNPASFSGQMVYGWRVLDVKAGFERMQKWNRGGDEFTQTTFYPDFGKFDSVKLAQTSTAVNAYLRTSGFRLGAAFHPFREAGFSPFFGIGGSFGSAKGRGDSVAVVTDTVLDSNFVYSTSRTNSFQSQVAEFSESFSGFYLEAGAQARLPYNFFFVFEAIRDFRSKDKAGVIGPAKGGGTLLGIRLGYRF